MRPGFCRTVTTFSRAVGSGKQQAVSSRQPDFDNSSQRSVGVRAATNVASALGVGLYSMPSLSRQLLRL